jgi:hypothetical protein
MRFEGKWIDMFNAQRKNWTGDKDWGLISLIMTTETTTNKML